MQGIIAIKTQENKEFNLLVISTVEIIKMNESIYIYGKPHIPILQTL